MKDIIKKYRNFCFTMNNYEDTILVDSIACKYIAYSKEVSSTGTPHLQGFICFENATSLGSVITKMPGCHISTMNGSLRQNELYCSKENDLIERGVKPLSNDDKGRCNQLRYKRAYDNAKIGNFDAIDADMMTRHYNTYKRIHIDYHIKPAPLPEVTGLWIHGPAGVGKSNWVFKTYPDHYIKSRNQWWQSYQLEDVVCLDDLGYTDSSKLISYLKDWGGQYPFQAETKGGSMQIRPKLFIVTSQYSIENLYRGDADTIAALKRRFTIMPMEFNNVCE